ncbi:uncharacterized protein LOC111750705 [Loxodonta africana]|uniref:uncharacterized protein LOC111750705 n=1 Tax=Loxodonta africana TaxID=9785 RepID=UPI0030CBE52F
MAPLRVFLPLLLLLLVQGTGSHREMKDTEEKRDASFLVSCVCQLLLNASEKACFQIKESTCPENVSTWGKNPPDEPVDGRKWTNCRLQDSTASNDSLDSPDQLLCSENTTTLKPVTESNGLSSLGTAATAVSASVGVAALILFLVGLLSLILKKWRHERLFKRQLRHHSNFLHQSSVPSCHADAVYSNVINLAPWTEEDFVFYANVPPFDSTRGTSPDHVEYASIVFH